MRTRVHTRHKQEKAKHKEEINKEKGKTKGGHWRHTEKRVTTEGGLH